MSNKKGFPFILGIIAVIVGVALFKKIDFQNLTVQKPALSAVYFITFIACVVLIIKDRRKPE